jgi:hypothetical protein
MRPDHRRNTPAGHGVDSCHGHWNLGGFTRLLFNSHLPVNWDFCRCYNLLRRNVRTAAGDITTGIQRELIIFAPISIFVL